MLRMTVVKIVDDADGDADDGDDGDGSDGFDSDSDYIAAMILLALVLQC
jgi:hypothetical protein